MAIGKPGPDPQPKPGPVPEPKPGPEQLAEKPGPEPRPKPGPGGKELLAKAGSKKAAEAQ